jgi:Fe-S oxidoreductase
MSQREMLEAALYRCNKCGFCQSACPFYLTTREEWSVGRGRLRLVKALQEGDLPASSGYLRAIYQCFSCSACNATCPSGVLVEEILFSARRDATRQGMAPEPLVQMGKALTASGSLTGEPGEARLSWAQNLDFEPRQGGQHELLYFVGCVSSLYPQAFGLPQSMASLLEMQDEDYGILGGDEVCCGYPLYIAGFEDEARAMAEANLRSVRGAGASRVLTTCPSCYRAWHQFYPELLGCEPGVEVIHATQWLAEAELDLKPLGQTVTYQDPCDLGRASGIYDEPRAFLRGIDGLELVEMPFNQTEGLCCGGGGNMESMDLDASRAVVQLRMEQAAGTGASTVITACPQCKRTLSAGRSREMRLRVMDIVELAWRQAQ